MMSDRLNTIYHAIYDAAETGAPMPNDLALAQLVGARSAATGGVLLDLLVLEGRILIHRRPGGSRVVEIVGSGLSAASAKPVRSAAKAPSGIDVDKAGTNPARRPAAVAKPMQAGRAALAVVEQAASAKAAAPVSAAPARAAVPGIVTAPATAPASAPAPAPAPVPVPKIAAIPPAQPDTKAQPPQHPADAADFAKESPVAARAATQSAMDEHARLLAEAARAAGRRPEHAFADDPKQAALSRMFPPKCDYQMRWFRREPQAMTRGIAIYDA